MAGEIQLNSTTMATESSGSITAELDTIRPNTTNGSLTLQGDSSDAGVTGLTIDSSGNATFAQTITGGTIGSSVVFPALGNSAVGTVSESSGTPTGDVIERGSNANGEYVKFADGTLICTQKTTGLDSTTLDLRHNSTPATFINSDFITQATPQDVSSAAANSNKKLFCIITPDSTTNPSTTTFPRVIVNTDGSTNADGVYLTAIGRWY